MYAYEHSEKFRDIVNAVFAKVKEIVVAVIENIKANFEALKQKIMAVIDFIRSIPEKALQHHGRPLPHPAIRAEDQC